MAVFGFRRLLADSGSSVCVVSAAPELKSSGETFTYLPSMDFPAILQQLSVPITGCVHRPFTQSHTKIAFTTLHLNGDKWKEDMIIS